MTDLHIKALGNTPEAIRSGACFATVKALTAEGAAALAALSLLVRDGELVLPSAEAAAFGESCHANGLRVRYN